ncbi:hypothetical protein PanWU01x14_293680, partial [Parasponia andersonii]
SEGRQQRVATTGELDCWQRVNEWRRSSACWSMVGGLRQMRSSIAGEIRASKLQARFGFSRSRRNEWRLVLVETACGRRLARGGGVVGTGGSWAQWSSACWCSARWLVLNILGLIAAEQGRNVFLPKFGQKNRGIQLSGDLGRVDELRGAELGASDDGLIVLRR